MAEGVEGIAVNGLSYSYGGASAALSNVSFTLPRGSRCLLVGRNGAGKSTLLELLAGSRMDTTRSIKVLGKDPFRESGMTAHLKSSERGAGTEGSVFAEAILNLPGLDPSRRDEVMQVLRVHPKLDLSRCSRGEWRRVQMACALLMPRSLLLLDEVTSELDMITRCRLFDFLKKEAAGGATVFVCTHVFDGLEGWPTHFLHLRDGAVANAASVEECLMAETPRTLYELVSSWLGRGPVPAKLSVSGFTLPAFPGDVCVKATALNLSLGLDADKAVLRDVALVIPRGARCVLVGGTGVGKSSLVSVIAGKRLSSGGDVRVFGFQPFKDFGQLDRHIVLLSDEWRRQMGEIRQARDTRFDTIAASLIASFASEGWDASALEARRDRLCSMLEVNPSWTVVGTSDGQQRRVQLVLALMKPRSLTILDEATADLDLPSRYALLDLLREDSELLGVTVVLCAQALDGLDGWMTHCVYLQHGGDIGFCGPTEELPVATSSSVLAETSPFHRLVRSWLEADADKAVDEVSSENRRRKVAGGVDASDTSLPSGWGWRSNRDPGSLGSHAWDDGPNAREVTVPSGPGFGGPSTGGFGAGLGVQQPPMGGFGAPIGQPPFGAPGAMAGGPGVFQQAGAQGVPNTAELLGQTEVLTVAGAALRNQTHDPTVPSGWGNRHSPSAAMAAQMGRHM